MREYFRARDHGRWISVEIGRLCEAIRDHVKPGLNEKAKRNLKPNLCPLKPPGIQKMGRPIQPEKQAVLLILQFPIELSPCNIAR